MVKFLWTGLGLSLDHFSMQWFTGKNGTTAGPFTEAEMQRMAGSGELNPDDLVWREGDANWQAAKMVATFFPALAALAAPMLSIPPPMNPPPGANPYYAAPRFQESFQAEASTPRPPNHLVWSIVTTLLCCLPLGIAAIIYSCKVEGLHLSGNTKGAIQAANTAKTLNFVSLLLGVLIILLNFAGVIGALVLNR